MKDWTVQEALEKRAHFIALGSTEIWLHRDSSEKPWNKVTRVEAGGAYLLSMPNGVKLSAEIDGLTFYWYVNFEKRAANGLSVSIFDRDTVRELYRKIPSHARRELSDLLKRECLPAMAARTAELRDALNTQVDSEDCIRGIIAWAEAYQ